MDEFCTNKYGTIERSYKSRLRKRWLRKFKRPKDNTPKKELLWLKEPFFFHGNIKYVFKDIKVKYHGSRHILLLTCDSVTWALEDKEGKISIRTVKECKPFNAKDYPNIAFLDKKLRELMKPLSFSELDEYATKNFPMRTALESDAYLFYSPEVLKQNPPNIQDNWVLQERKEEVLSF